MNKRPCDFENGSCPFEATGNMDCYNNCGLGATQHERNDDEFSEDDIESKPSIKVIVNIQELLIEGVYVNTDDYDVEVLVIETDKESDQSKEEEENERDKITSFSNNEHFEPVSQLEISLIDYEHTVEV